MLEHGAKKWSMIAGHLPGRIGKQCRERWHNHLNPDIKRDGWSEEEDRILVEAHEAHGNKWAEIAKRPPRRRGICEISFNWNLTIPSAGGPRLGLGEFLAPSATRGKSSPKTDRNGAQSRARRGVARASRPPGKSGRGDAAATAKERRVALGGRYVRLAGARRPDATRIWHRLPDRTDNMVKNFWR